MSIKELFNKHVKVHHCETVEEAVKQAKERKKLLYISGILAATYLILSLIGNKISFFEILSTFPMIGAALFFGVGIWTLIQAHNEKTRLTLVICPDCKTKYDFNNVEYELKTKRESSGSTDNNGNRKFRVFHRYGLTCTCSNCGKVKYFENDFLEREGTKDRYGNVIREYPRDLDADICNFFK